VVLLALLGTPVRAATSFVAFESDPVRPIALSPGGTRLFAANAPDGRLEIFLVTASGLLHEGSVPVGLEPVAVAARSESEVWVVNQLSDSVSVVEVTPSPRVVRTLLVGDEPRDIVFAGPGRSRAFVSAARRGQNLPGNADLGVPGQGRANVWVFDATNLGASAGGDPLTVLTLFGDMPRSSTPRSSARATARPASRRRPSATAARARRPARWRGARCRAACPPRTSTRRASRARRRASSSSRTQ
jgi:hypothetical protein